MNYQAAHEIASQAAKKAAYNMMGPESARDYCGFAWVEAPKIKMTSKEGKALKALGFKKMLGPAKGACLWNPAKMATQSVEVLYAGAQAYAEAFEAATGIQMQADKRLD